MNRDFFLKNMWDRAIAWSENLAKRKAAHECEALNLRKEQQDIRNTCPHLEFFHHPPATAECESWDECKVCGETL